MSKAILTALALCALLALSPLARAAEPADSAGTVRFCFNNWPPYSVMEAGEPRGISVEILAEASRRAGLEARFQELPWNRCLEMVKQGKLDAVMDAAKRDGYLQGPNGYVVYSNTVWVREADHVEGMTLEHLGGKRMGLVDGYVYPESLTAAFESHGMKIERSVDDEQNLNKLVFSRVDAIIADYGGTLYLARERNLAIRALMPAHSFDTLYPSFYPGSAALHERIDAALDRMMRDGTIERIYRAHLGVGLDEVLGR